MIDLDNDAKTHAAELISRMADIAERRDILDDSYRQLRESLIELLGLGRFEIGQSRVSITESRRFSPTLAARVLDPATLVLISTMTVDRELAKQYLTSEQLDMCGGPGVVTVKLS